MYIFAAVWALLVLSGLITAWRDPRRLRPGLYFAAAGVLAVMLVVFLGVAATGSELTAAWTLIAVGICGLLAIGALGTYLIVNGADLARKEGVRPATLLSSALGTLLIGYVVAVFIGVVIGWFDAAASNTFLLFVLAIGLPAGYLGSVFVAFLGWSLAYAIHGRRRARKEPVGAVIVLGAGLIGGDRVSPLLAGRLDRGRELLDTALGAGLDPILVCSGGRGGDERLSEAEAMSNHLAEQGVDADRLRLEDASTDTAENLAFTKRLLDENHITGVAAVVTSDYHAFRAATLMRSVGIDGFSTGAHTATYFFPNAQVREFVAILRDHWQLNLAVVVVLSVPWVMALVHVL
ncbi:YdcF family protein [Gordonia sp. PKS22-38]|uniref:YdcF family protein n=1 Tax=Gordonia prachuapensis TaxID=3115651 RepID=A0ABU7MMC2_9ACTN|nr:YdcF family protein [Gordonia sp. PKS22-38]